MVWSMVWDVANFKYSGRVVGTYMDPYDARRRNLMSFVFGGPQTETKMWMLCRYGRVVQQSFDREASIRAQGLLVARPLYLSACK